MRSFKEFQELKEDLSIGADYEPAIVVGYYKASRRVVPSPEKMSISAAEYKKVIKQKQLMKAGEDIAKKLLPKVKKGKEAKQLGSSSSPITPFWSKWGGRNTTPKTDLMIGAHRISLKIGPAQLMSASVGEATATFQAALKDPKVKNLSRTKDARAIMADFEKFVRVGYTEAGGVEDNLKGRAKKGNRKVQKNKLLARGDKFHKKFMVDMGVLFERSDDFKIAFVREAMTGEYKFGKRSEAYAQWFLVGNKSGSAISYHSANNRAYLKKVSDLVSIDVRFKSNSEKKSIDGVKTKTGRYRFYSVLGLGLSKLEVMKEEVMAEHRMLFEEELTEGMLGDIWNKFTSWLKDLLDKVTAWAMESAENMIEFFQAEPEVTATETLTFPT